MRKAPQLRFPGFEGGWQQYRMGDLTRIFDGTHQTPKYVSSGIPFYSVENVTANNFTDTKYITEEVFTKETKRIERGDILMTRIGDIGTARCIDWDVKASFYVSLALIKSSEALNSKFLCHYIASDYFQDELWAQTLHVAFPKKINLGDIGSCKISISDIREQQKIADFLTAVDERIELQSNKVEKLQTYKRGLTQKIFTRTLRFKRDDGSDFPEWKKKKLGDIATVKTGNLNVQDADETAKYIFFDRSEEIKRYREYSFNKEALIYPGEGAKFLPRYFNGKFGLHQRAYAIFDTDGILTKFLYYYLLTKNNHFISTAVGTTVKSLRMNCFESCPVVVPNLDEQQKIATFLSQIDEKITLETEKLKGLKKFKKSLLQRMFV